MNSIDFEVGIQKSPDNRHFALLVISSFGLVGEFLISRSRIEVSNRPQSILNYSYLPDPGGFVYEA